jgi:hypothetical protein
MNKPSEPLGSPYLLDGSRIEPLSREGRRVQEDGRGEISSCTLKPQIKPYVPDIRINAWNSNVEQQQVSAPSQLPAVEQV